MVSQVSHMDHSEKFIIIKFKFYSNTSLVLAQIIGNKMKVPEMEYR